MNRQDRPDSYYQFDDEKREIRFLRYDMPTPWMNYLSNGTFHTMISHAGGGVAFYKSPQIWRLNHYRFFHLPTDRSGFYTYIKDGETIWCPTNMPVSERPEEWQSAHGMGYTRFEAKKKGVEAEALYYVGPEENALIWELSLTADEDKTVTVYPYVELGMMEFMRELQWQCYNKHQLSVSYMEEEEILVYRYGVETQPKPDQTPLVFFAADVPVASFEGDRDEFIGAYRSEECPEGLEQERLGNSLLMGGDPCFVFQLPVKLRAGEKRTIHIFLGTAMTQEEIKAAAVRLRQKDSPKKAFEALKNTWEEYFSHFQAKLPDEAAARMINFWNPYQAQRNFLFSRNLSYYATGTFRGVGYRDTAQDILAMVPFDINAAKEKTKLLLTQQYKDGHVNHYFFPVEGYEPVTSVHSDDHLWTILTVWHIVKEEGSLDFLGENVSFYDGGEGTVYEHLKRAVDFTQCHMGKQGFPLMLRSDWNDALFRVCREGKGESIWTSMQFGTVLRCLKEMAFRLKDTGTAKMCEELYEQQKKRLNEKAWDKSWYCRAIMDNGEYLGRMESPEARIWLNAQTWAVISGMGEPDKVQIAMDSVYRILNTPLGIKKIDPPIVNFPDPKEPLTNYNPGTGENGSVFCHANTWAIIAECLLGNGDRAYEYYRQLIPAVAMEKAGVWRYKAEPYVYASNIFGPDSIRFGLANVSWLTGTAAWMYVAATQYILGIRASFDGLIVDPKLPSAWRGKEIRVTRKFREQIYEISIVWTEDGREHLEVNGKPVEGKLVPYRSQEEKSVKVICYLR